jgi:hypothetical protein
MRSQQEEARIKGKCLTNGCLVYAPDGHVVIEQGTVQRFTCDMVPVGACLIVD